jgi:hypothetical protein
LFTQERDVTIVDRLGSLNNIMKQRRDSPHQNTSRIPNGNPQGRNFIAALTVGRVTPDQIHLKYTRKFILAINLTAALTVGRATPDQIPSKYTREYTRQRKHIAVINVGRVLLHLAS